MRPVSAKQRREQASTLVVAIVLSLVIMVALASLVHLLTTEYRMVHRSIHFSQAMNMAEAGIEEGVAMLNHGDEAWSANGWTLSSGSYVKTVTNITDIGDSYTLGSYSMTITNASGANPQILGVGTVTNRALASATTRRVLVTLGKQSPFQWGLLAQSTVNMNGNNFEVDSFDSSDPNHSDYDYSDGYGTYDASERKDNGDVATNATITNSISVGNANIFGHVHTGSGGTVSIGPNGFVGSLTNYSNGVINSERISHSMNMYLAAPTSPFTTGVDVGSINNSTTLTGGAGSPVDYVASGVSLSGSKTLTFDGGYSRLYITGNVSTSGNAEIIIKKGSKVEIYVVGSMSVSGNGAKNESGLAANMQMYVLGNQSVSVSGNGEFTGVLYAPSSDVSVSGNGTITGAVVANSFTLSGNAKVHYDEALENLGSAGDFAILSWQEL